MFALVLLGLILVVLFATLDHMARKAERAATTLEQRVQSTQPYVNLLVLTTGAIMVWMWLIFHALFGGK
jgi:hypothetical protein